MVLKKVTGLQKIWTSHLQDGQNVLTTPKAIKPFRKVIKVSNTKILLGLKNPNLKRRKQKYLDEDENIDIFKKYSDKKEIIEKIEKYLDEQEFVIKKTG